MKNNILQEFRNRFDNPQIYVKSPGRANIIGEHTDYNHGLVFPFAIEHSIHMAMATNSVGLLRMHALDIEQYAEVDIYQLSFRTEGWTRYAINALVALGVDIESGIDVVFGGDLPRGGGVSSSSALTCGFLAGANALLGTKHDLDTIISLASQAENGIGLNGGIMDQTAILKGKKGKALMIDFLDYALREYDLDDQDCTFYLFNSGQKHNLVDTAYNQRRATCEAAVAYLASHHSAIKTMRDVTQDHIDLLTDETARKRCQHVVDESNRVLQAGAYLNEGQTDKLGPLLLASHHSLSKLYEVSTPEIDYLVKISQYVSNILGSRIMGGGFGGCTINLVKGQLDQQDLDLLAQDYKAMSGYDLEVISIKASDGVRVENV